MDYLGDGTLYHYTSAAGLRGILESRSIWLSDIRSLNDPRELIFGQEVFLPRVCQWIEINFAGANKIALLDAVVQKFEADATKNQFFSASFCPEADSRHLWKNYADDGKGVAIGVPGDVLGTIGNPQIVLYPAMSVEDFASSLMHLFDAEFATSKRDLISEQPNQAVKSFTVALMRMYLASKERVWADEREVRTVWAQYKPKFREYPPDSRQANGDPRYFSLISRRSAYGNVDYMVRNLWSRYRNVNPIPEIVLGPDCSVEPEEIRELTEGRGFPRVAVRRSWLPSAG